MSDWKSTDGAREPDPATVAQLDQSSAAVHAALTDIVNAQVNFRLAEHVGDTDRMKVAASEAVRLVLETDFPIIASCLLTLASKEATIYVEACGGPDVMNARADQGVCPCGEDCPKRGEGEEHGLEVMERWVNQQHNE